MQYLRGISASGGRTVGPLCYIQHARACKTRAADAPQKESARAVAALRQAREELLCFEQKAPPADKDIFMVQRMMLEDRGLCEKIQQFIENGICAAVAVERAGEGYAQQLRALPDDYLAQRACDVLDASSRVVDKIDGGAREKTRLTRPSILLSDEIYPTDLVMQKREIILGFVSSRGSPCAHASILARDFGIPAVVQVGAALMAYQDGQFAAMDGTSGEIYFTSDAAKAAQFIG